MTRLALAVPGDPGARTGGTLYDRRMARELECLGWHVDWIALPDAFPFAGPDDIEAACRALSAVPDGAMLLVDGLALGAMPGEALDRLGRGFVALVHHPLAYETGLDPETARHFAGTERAALARAQAIVTTSRETAALLASAFAVDEADMTVVEPGTDPASRARGSSSGEVHVVCLGSLTPRKGQDLLVEALSEHTGLSWRCTIAGAERDPAFAASLRRLVCERGLEERIEFRGEIDEAQRDDLLDSADIFALASLFEGYGMVFAEALARGLPIVGFSAGAVPGVVPPEAGRLVAPGNSRALANALALLISDERERRRLADGAWAAGRALPTWSRSAERLASTLLRVRGER